MEEVNKNIISISSTEQGLDEATEWLMLLNTDHIEKQTIETFTFWIRKEKKHLQYFQEVLQVWQLASLIEPNCSNILDKLLNDERSIAG